MDTIRLTTILIPILVSICLASPLASKDATPTVTIQNGTVEGSSENGIDSFLGIPFAQPPTGSLRLKPPVPLTSSFGTLNATAEPAGCPQFVLSVGEASILETALGSLVNTPIFRNFTGPTSEDCLTLNVQRPSNLISDFKLPVLVWIYGGAFALGTSSFYPLDNLLLKSIEIGKPMIIVAANYRVAGFGFLAGKELQAEGSTNIGLRDQRLALQWVQENIEAFGGDPDKVTLWGESAGSISVFDHTIINRGDHTYNSRPLFRAAMMDSGSIIQTQDVASAKPQAIYDAVVSHAGCSAGPSSPDCLRALDLTKFSDALAIAPGLFNYDGLTLSYLPRPDPTSDFFPSSPEDAVSQDQVANVPIIVGDQQDEGTLFSQSQSNITTTDGLVSYISSQWSASPDTAAAFVSLYPDDPAAGSPYGTGLFNVRYPQYKRLASMVGDILFDLTRRLYLSRLPTSVPKWTYLSTYLHGFPLLGTLHATDLLVALNVTNSEIFFPGLTNAVQRYYINMVYDMDPGSELDGEMIEWPQWTVDGREMLEFDRWNLGHMKDDYREEAFQFWTQSISEFRS